MKKNLIYIVTLTIGLFMYSCSDSFLDDKKMYNQYDESIFENETQTGWYIDKIYYDFFNGYNSPAKVLVGKWEDRNNLTEEQAGMSNKLVNPKEELITSDDGNDYYGDRLGEKVVNNSYTRIRNCTFVIDNLDEKGIKISESFKKTAKGQMYFFRALQYFDLLRTYGGVPLVTSIQSPSSTDESIKLPRALPGECVELILSDLDQAAGLLPDKWDDANYGRLTRAAALAMKSRVLLTYACPVFNKNWDSDKTRWQAALDASLKAESELSAAGYGLYGSSAKDWAEMFLVDNKFCKEVIMANLMSPNVKTAQNNGWEASIRLKSQSGSGGVKAPQEMIDLFPMADGSRPTADNGYDPFLFFLDRDPRFYRTFAFSGSEWGHKQDSKETVWAYRYLYSKDGKELKKYSDENDVNTPAFVRKMSDPNADRDGGLKYSGVDIFYYRYAELLLNIAECYAALDDKANCIKYLSMIRARVGIPSANNYGIGNLSDKYAALEACLYERRVELAYEGIRVWDMQRWMLYNDEGDNNTCQKLRVEPLNGRARIGHYLQVKTIGTSDADPLKEERKELSVNPNSTTFQDDLMKLAQFYKDNFELIDPDTPLDNVNNDPVTVLWRQHYYMWGLKRVVLANNPWIEQTKGWLDASGGTGTFDYQK